MDRIGKDKLMMNTALSFAEQSTCCRVHAGAVITFDNRIISTGYNGNAPGRRHCWDYFHEMWFQNTDYETIEEYFVSSEFKDAHHEWAIDHELHGEMNAIIYAARKGFSIEGGVLYTSFSPCIFCTKAIIHSGLLTVYYHTLYDRSEGKRSIEILKENNIKIQQIT